MRLEQRLTALEARHAPVAEGMPTDETRAMSHAIRVFLDAAQPDGMRGPARALLKRLDTGTETDGDRALLEGIPTCHLTTHELVAMAVRVDDLC